MLCTVREVNRFLEASRSGKILSIPERIIHAALPLLHLINMLYSGIPTMGEPIVRKSDYPAWEILEPWLCRANRLGFCKDRPQEAGMAGRKGGPG
jgi:hypothetical protein